MPLTGAVIGSGVLGLGGSIFGGKSQRKAADTAAQAQLQAARESIAAQERGAERGFDVFQREADKARGFLTEQNALARQELAPLREVGLENIQRAAGFADPNSPEAQAERDVFQKQLAQNLSARGLTASGTEVAGLSDFETKLARERRNIALGLAGQGANTLQSLSGLQSGLGANLAGISQNLGNAGSSLFGNLGQSAGNTLFQAGSNAAGLQLQGANAATQGVIGGLNALQGIGQNLITLGRQRGLSTGANQTPLVSKGQTLSDLAFIG